MMENSSKEVRPRGIYLLPNLFTIGSLFAGFFAIVASLKSNFEGAIISTYFAMIMDSLDGRVARLTNTMTAFGAEFDSLTDMVSFAVAPAILAFSWGLATLGKFGWLAAFVFTVSVALRLARFNTQLGKMDKRYFQGLPCPAGAAVVISSIWLCLDLDLNSRIAYFIMAIAMITTGVLMVSNIRYRSFKDVNLKHNVRFVVILLVVLLVVLISVAPANVLFAGSVGYAISGPIATIWGLRQKRQLRRQLVQKKHQRKHGK